MTHTAIQDLGTLELEALPMMDDKDYQGKQCNKSSHAPVQRMVWKRN